MPSARAAAAHSRRDDGNRHRGDLAAAGGGVHGKRAPRGAGEFLAGLRARAKNQLALATLLLAEGGLMDIRQAWLDHLEKHGGMAGELDFVAGAAWMAAQFAASALPPKLTVERTISDETLARLKALEG